jgi:hypothetical protein
VVAANSGVGSGMPPALSTEEKHFHQVCAVAVANKDNNARRGQKDDDDGDDDTR